MKTETTLVEKGDTLTEGGLRGRRKGGMIKKYERKWIRWKKRKERVLLLRR